MRIIALDVGSKRIGVAVSDESATIAQGIDCIDRVPEDKAVNSIKSLIEEYKADKIIVGLPVNMNGTMGERAFDCENFAKKIDVATSAQVIMWDERLSTKEAEDIMIMADVSRKKRKRIIDKMAAQLILQSYLDCNTENGKS